jgi:hypothetical protein
MNNPVIIKAAYRIIFTGSFFVFLTNSCSTSSDIPCPDFRNNRSYSKKYLPDNRLNKNLHKNYSAKRTDYIAFQIYSRQKYRNMKSRDFTINPDKAYHPESLQIKSIPGITEFKIHGGIYHKGFNIRQ